MAVAPPVVARALVFHAPGDLRVEAVTLSPPGPGELLLRITACGLCPGEVMDWYVARKAPVPLGHEAVGVVIAAGAGVTYRPGERVFVHHHAPCLGCRTCARGDFVHCETWRPRRLIPGGVATHAIAQAEAVVADAFRIPPEIPDDTATFIEPLACVVKSLRRARLRKGDRVLVMGAGVMGLLHLMALRARGEPALVIAADRVPQRLEAASRFADVVVDVRQHPLREATTEVTSGEGVDVVIVGPGTIEALQTGLDCLAPGGTLVMFTPPPPEVWWPVDGGDLFFREKTIVATYSSGPDDTREALGLLHAGLPVTSLITHRLPLDQAAAGYDLVRTATSALKVVVIP
jgi:L-iditol 2-dehydrogenase